jgi:hypothetical protein
MKSSISLALTCSAELNEDAFVEGGVRTKR